MTRRRRDWVVGALAGLAGIGATAGFAGLVVGVVDGGGPPDPAEATGRTSVGQDVRAVVAADGSVEVTHRVVVTKLVASIRLRTGPTYGDAGAIEDVEVVSAGTSVPAALAPDGGARPIALGRPVLEFTVTYRVAAPLEPAAPVVDGEPVVVGRALVFVPTLEIEFADESGPLRRQVVADGEILNVACVRRDAAPPRPCGASIEGGWEVDLDARGRDVGLVVQLQEG